MPTFPRRKADIDALAGAIAAGITANPADYPPATFATAALTAAITAKNAAVTDRQQKEADLGLAVEAENDAAARQGDRLPRLRRQRQRRLRAEQHDDGGAVRPTIPASCSSSAGAARLSPRPTCRASRTYETLTGEMRRLIDLAEATHRASGTNTITEDWGAWQRSATASEYTATE